MKLTVKIAMDNAAFEPINGVEVATILKQIIGKIYDRSFEAGEHMLLYDSNGNKVGKLEVK